jgi:KaiC/GvpD/RAD55 family RecA-like ATPase
MQERSIESAPSANQLPKAPSGIRGLDEITGGGLPRGLPTLICGGAGCGKTLFAMEFLVRGVTEYGEPGVFIAFEETAEELAANVASLGSGVSPRADGSAAPEVATPEERGPPRAAGRTLDIPRRGGT